MHDFQIQVLKDGQITDFGSTSKLLGASSELSQYLQDEEQEQDNEEKEENDDKKEEKSEKKDTEKKVEAKEKTAKEKKAAAAEKRIKDEGVLSGRVKAMAYSMYFSAVGYINCVFILLTFLANQVGENGRKCLLLKVIYHDRLIS